MIPIRSRHALVPAFLLLQGLVAQTHAATTATLPAMTCKQPDTVFTDRFDATAWTSDPSLGTSTIVGNITRTISIAGIGARTYYLHVPTNYVGTHAWPLLIVLHGAAGSPADAQLAAQQVRSDWSGWADSRGFIVLAPIGSSPQGSWEPYPDEEVIAYATNDATARYNIEQNRLYLWGFSAGAHVAHDFVLSYNSDVFAAYAVNAGSLQEYACLDSGTSPYPQCNAYLSAVARKVPVDIHLGSEDPLYAPPPDAAHDANRFENNGWVAGRNVHSTVFYGGHEYTVDQLGDIWNSLCPNALVP